MTMTERNWSRTLAGLCGIVGPVMLVASFAINPSPPAGLAPAELAAWAEPRAGLMLLGGGMQGIGSLLIVIFALALVQLSGAADGFVGCLTHLAGGTILVVSLIEVAFYLAAAQAIASGDITLALVSGGLIRAAEHVFLIAPSLLIPLGLVLLKTRVLARPFAYSGLIIGACLQVLVLARVIGAVQPAVDGVLIVQSAWFVAAGGALALSAMRLAPTDTPLPSDDMVL
ncbi:MAG: hypothetical protein JWO83_4380 [Caulobacteraceae bacterium]|jgi:hypothetical protein|nr:hypothetical protein [Caulobacteraceae bacterium]